MPLLSRSYLSRGAQPLTGASHSTAPADIIQDPLTEDDSECCPRLFVIDHHHLYPPCTLSPPQSASKIFSFSRKAPLYPLNQQTTRLSSPDPHLSSLYHPSLAQLPSPPWPTRNRFRSHSRYKKFTSQLSAPTSLCVLSAPTAETPTPTSLRNSAAETLYVGRAVWYWATGLSTLEVNGA